MSEDQLRSIAESLNIKNAKKLDRPNLGFAILDEEARLESLKPIPDNKPRKRGRPKKVQQPAAAQPASSDNEVKAEENLRSRSLKAVLAKDSTLRGLRISMSDYRKEENFDNLPLYAIKSFELPSLADSAVQAVVQFSLLTRTEKFLWATVLYNSDLQRTGF